jgi:hypothetical protein
MNPMHKSNIGARLFRRIHCHPQRTSNRLHSKKRNLKLRGVGSRENLAGSLGTLAEHLSGLVATDTTTPVTALLLVLVRAAEAESDCYPKRITLR